jgi:N6-adenosine-specific RNA methylase IME4
MSEALFGDEREVVAEPEWSGEPFQTLLVDPPWAYQTATRSKKLTGYANYEYQTLDTPSLAALPVADVCATNAVMVLWSTWPFLPDALELLQAWGFEYKTALPWVKVEDVTPTTFKPTYGVGYWFRGCTEPILIGLRGKGSYRTPWVGLLSESARHSRKPESIYELAESFGSPRLEMFSRERREGWVSLGNEIGGKWSGDIRETLPKLAAVVRG